MLANKDPYWLFRVTQGKKQIEAANEAKINSAKLSHIENRIIRPTEDEKQRLAKVLGLAPQDIWNEGK